MTLNQIRRRIKSIVLAHKQVRTFGIGPVSDIQAKKDVKYPLVSLRDLGGNISIVGKVTTVNYKMFFLDLINVSEDTRENEQDILSDMISVATDIVAQINNPNFSDWRISTDNSLQLVIDEESDYCGGCAIDFSISFMFTQNRCQIPTDFFDETTTYDLMYDVKYTATGDEGNTIPSSLIPEIAGKKILMITREFAPLYKVSNNPTASEFTWNKLVIGLGSQTNPGERFLILYRNY
jgi:hypothetical protein